MIPLNARVFLRNILRDEDDVGSLINPEDLSAPQVEEIYRRIDFHDERNALDESKYRDLIPAYEKHLTEYPKTSFGRQRIREGLGAELLGPSVMDEHHAGVAGYGGLSDSERYQSNLEGFNRDVQAKLDKTKLAVESYGKERGKTSVGYDSDTDADPVYYYGPKFMDTIVNSFTSPAYNINTTLGQFNAFKNEDGTVTISDTYDWGGQENNPYRNVGDMSMLDFIKIVPMMVSRPESAGNVLMRTLFKDKSSPVEFTLPPRERDLSTEMPEDYREGGRVRLI